MKLRVSKSYSAALFSGAQRTVSGKQVGELLSVVQAVNEAAQQLKMMRCSSHKKIRMRRS